MEKAVFGLIIFSVHFLLVSAAPEQIGCVEGESLTGVIQLKLTVLPSLTVEVFSEISIICDADIPRFSSLYGIITLGLLQPTIRIHIDMHTVKECSSTGVSSTPVNQCIYNITSFYPGIPRRISCTAFNSLGGCRFKTANIRPLPPVPPTNGTTTGTIKTSNYTTPTNTSAISPATISTTASASKSTAASDTDQISTPRRKRVDGNGDTLPASPATTSTTASASKPTTVSDTGEISTPRKFVDDNGDWILGSTVGASVAVLIIVVLSVVAVVFFRKWGALEHLQRKKSDSIANNFKEMKTNKNCDQKSQDEETMEHCSGNEGIYSDETAPAPSYMSLKDNREPEKVYQSLQSPCTSVNLNGMVDETDDQFSTYMSLDENREPENVYQTLRL